MKTKLRLMILIRIVAFGIIFLSWGLIPAILVTAIFLIPGFYAWGIRELPDDWIGILTLFFAELCYLTVILLAIIRFALSPGGLLLGGLFFIFAFGLFNFAHTRSD